MNPINLSLTVEQVNAILNALAAGPYVQVSPLIAEIQKQGQEQLAAPVAAEVKE